MSLTFASSSPRSRSRVLFRWLGLAMGVALLALALFFVARHWPEVSQAFAQLRDAPAWMLAALLLTVVGNLVFTALLFSHVMSRPPTAGRVGLWEMQALIAASTLLNYVPLRPGLLGRVAYHTLVNRIEVRHTAFTMIAAIALSILTGVTILVVLLLTMTFDIPLALLALPFAGCVLGATLFASPPLRFWIVAWLIRWADVASAAARYWLVFSLLGKPIPLETALACACIATFATMVPFLSSGLGLREWTIGLVAPMLVIDLASPLAIAADLLARAAELAVTVAAGLAGVAFVARRWRNATARISQRTSMVN